jgi:hypothetical protein
MVACCMKECPVVCIRWERGDKVYWVKQTG